MKHFLKLTLLGFAWSGLACFGSPVTFNNYGVLDTPTNITALHFNNYGLIEFGTGTLYNTYGTATYTNTGTMIGSQGFRFADVTPKTIIPSTSFVNRGSIIGQDSGGFVIVGVGGGGSSTIPSDIVVDAKNVANPGTLSVGASGTMTVVGQNVDLSYGIMEAGQVAAGSETGTALAELYDWLPPGGPYVLYSEDAPNTYDLLWGVTNGLMGRVSGMITPDIVKGYYDVNLPGFSSTNRGGGRGFTSVFARGLTAFAFTYPNPNLPDQSTNFYYDVVLLDTNFVDGAGFVDTNTHVTVQFGDPTLVAGFNYVPTEPGVAASGNYLGVPILVTFYESVIDPISGQATTNSIYLEDDGDTLNPITISQNAEYTAPYSRPDSFELTFTQPLGLPPEALKSSNTNFDPGQIYTQGTMGAVESMTNAVYEAQVGSNPESLNGAFPSLTGVETTADIPDITNQPGRITINANNLNLHNLKLAASGFLEINGTNVTGIPTVFNYGTANINLASKTNSLLIADLIPVLFEQLRGDVEMWDGTWDNFQTNSTTTNEIHTHVLYIGHTLSARYTPTVRNFQLKSTNIVMQNNVEVIQSSLFNGRNLTVISNVYLTQGAASFVPANAPNLRNLFVTNGGSFVADSLLDIGFNLPVTVTSPVGRGYSVLSVTNQGFIEATAPTIKARTIENDGIMETANNGSLILAANTLGLGMSTNTASTIFAGGIVTLSANSIEMSNTVLDCNGLIMTPVKELADFVTGTIGTNSPGGISDLVNFVTVTNEMVLTRKPAHGDLYGTQIRLVAPPGAPTLLSWAGADKGDTTVGFENNAVIGNLILDRLTSDSILQLRAAGNKNALYVNHLELADASFSDYTNNTFVDPHLTIYVASANVPVEKLTNISPQIVYAANSVGAQAAIAARSEGAAIAIAPTGAAPGLPVARPPAGVYSGLFAPVSGATSGDFGYLTFTLAKNGSFSGRAQIGGDVVPFSSVLSGRGFGSVSAGALSVSFTIDSAGQAVGEVIGDGWSAALNAAVATASPSPFAGRYTLTLPGSGNGAPSGDSVAHVTVNKQGVVLAVGKLADGVGFTSSTRISSTGQWPFFAYSPSGKDVLSGWLNFGAAPNPLSGNVLWTKPSKAARAYPDGFQSVISVNGAASK